MKDLVKNNQPPNPPHPSLTANLGYMRERKDALLALLWEMSEIYLVEKDGMPDDLQETYRFNMDILREIIIHS